MVGHLDGEIVRLICKNDLFNLSNKNKLIYAMF